MRLHRSAVSRVAPALLLSVVFALGCQSPKKAAAEAPTGETGRPPAARPWTTRFMGRNVLFAEDVRVEGPKGLLDHMVTRPDTALHAVAVQTVPAGLLQSIRVKNGGDGEIRGQLDQLVIVATRSLSVLERPGDVPVVVAARGDVLYKDLATGQELRQATLHIEGRIGN